MTTPICKRNATGQEVCVFPKPEDQFTRVEKDWATQRFFDQQGVLPYLSNEYVQHWYQPPRPTRWWQ